MRHNPSPYLADGQDRRQVRWAYLRPLVPFLGFGVVSIGLMVSGGAAVALPSLVLISIVLGVGAVWFWRLGDRLDAAAQEGTDPSKEIITPAVAVSSPRPEARETGGVQKGILHLGRSTISWTPGPTSSLARFEIPSGELVGVSIISRGLFVRRGSLVVSTKTGRFAFATGARFERLLSGIEGLALPAAA